MGYSEEILRWLPIYLLLLLILLVLVRRRRKRKERLTLEDTPPSASQEATKAERKRGGCLSVVLVLMLIGGLWQGLRNVLAPTTVKADLLRFPTWTIPVFMVIPFAYALFATAIWEWKRWGVYGLAVMVPIVIGINLGFGTPLIGVLPPLLSWTIFAFLVRPIWGQMD